MKKIDHLPRRAAAAVFCSTLVLHACASAAIPPVPQALTNVIAALGDFKSLRMKSAQFETLVTPYCKRTDHAVEEYGVRDEYKCQPGSGITAITFDSRNENTPGKNYVMYVAVDLQLDHYAGVREQLTGKLGRTTKTDKDFVYWTYRGDKALNRLGNPAIMLSRDAAERTASFTLALEQGP